MDADRDRVEPAQLSLAGFLCKLFWMFGGHLILVACFILILRTPVWRLGALDAVYWGCLVAILLARVADRRGTDRSDGTPPAGMSRWALVTTLVATGAWLLGQSVHLMT